MRKLLRFFPVMLLTLFVLAAEVRADQVRHVTSGFFNMTFLGETDYSAEWSLRGPGITLLKSGGYDDGSVSTCSTFPCLPGEIIDLTFEAAGGLGESYVKVDDIVCADSDYPKCYAYTDLVLSGKVRLPPYAGPFTVTVPMSLSGYVRVIKCTLINEFGECVGSKEVFAASLRGEGTGTVSFYDNSAGFGPHFNVSYTIKPIPEPATMLLLGTGLAGIGMKIRKRRQAKDQ